jgi:transposase
MSSNLKRKHEPAFKAKVALEASKQTKTIPAIASEFVVHPTQVKKWKEILESNAQNLFVDKYHKADHEKDELIEQLYRQVGKLKVQADWLKKKLGIADD